MPRKLISIQETCARLGKGKSTIYRWQHLSENPFPRQLRLNDRVCGFVEEEVEAWIEARLEERAEHSARSAANEPGA